MKAVTFGEIMLRLKTPEYLRIVLRRYGTDTTHILRGGKRLGIYYFEKGNNIRPTNVVYDRADSAFACSKPD